MQIYFIWFRLLILNWMEQRKCLLPNCGQNYNSFAEVAAAFVRNAVVDRTCNQIDAHRLSAIASKKELDGFYLFYFVFLSMQSFRRPKDEE